MKTKKIFLLVLLLFGFATAKELKDIHEEDIFKAELVGGIVGYGSGNFMVGDNLRGGLYFLSDLAFFDGGIAMIVVGSVLNFNKVDMATSLSFGVIVLIVGIVLRVFEVMDVRSYIVQEKNKRDLRLSFDDRQKKEYYESYWRKKEDIMRLRWHF